MMADTAALGAVVESDLFPEADLALRRGRHVGRDDGPVYDFLFDALDVLEPFYRRFGCELIQRADGYFYLLPTGDRLGRRHLSAGEMLVGQALALLYLDPSRLQHGGSVARETLLQRLAGLLGAEELARMLGRRTRKMDERVAERAVRSKVDQALRSLADLGFVDMGDDDWLRLRPALMRFADPVRDAAEPGEALARLMVSGELSTTEAPEGADLDLDMGIDREDEA